MISSLRNKKKLITFSLWFIIAAFVGTIFFVWGVGTKTQDRLYAAKVNGVVISSKDFQDKVESTRAQFRRLFGKNVDEILKGNTLERTVMENLIDEALLTGEARRLGIPVSDAEVAAQVQSIKAFQVDGKFNQQRYVQLLQRNRLTPQVFEAGIKHNMLLKKMEDLIKQSVAISDKEINKEYIYRNSQASIRYLELNSASFAPQVKVTDDLVSKYYEANKEKYRVPEMADFKYVAFDPDTFKANPPVTEKEIESYFIKNKAAFKVPERVKASHIMLKVNDWKDETAANKVYQKAKKIREELLKGANFAKLAKKYSQDASAANGGELGYFTKGQMVPAFEKAAFATKPGHISGVVKTQFGFHIIKVEDHQQEKNPTLDEVKGKIKEIIQAQKSQSAFRTHVFDTYKAILDKSNISAYNEQAKEKLPVKVIKGLTAEGNIAPLKGNKEVAGRLMKLTKSEMSQVLDVSGEQMIFEMTAKHSSYIPKLKDIKDKVTKDFVNDESLKLTQQKAKEASALKTMDDAAEMLKKTYVTTPLFTRSEPIEGLGMNQRLMTDIFRSNPGEFLKDAYTVGSKVFIVQVKDIVKPDVKKMDSDTRDNIKSTLFGVKSDAAEKEYVLSLKKKAKIEISPRFAHYYK